MSMSSKLCNNHKIFDILFLFLRAMSQMDTLAWTLGSLLVGIKNYEENIE